MLYIWSSACFQQEITQHSFAPQAAARATFSTLTKTTDRRLAKFQPSNVEEFLIKCHVTLESAGSLSLGADFTHQLNSHARHAHGHLMKRIGVTAT